MAGEMLVSVLLLLLVHRHTLLLVVLHHLLLSLLRLMGLLLLFNSPHHPPPLNRRPKKSNHLRHLDLLRLRAAQHMEQPARVYQLLGNNGIRLAKGTHTQRASRRPGRVEHREDGGG